MLNPELLKGAFEDLESGEGEFNDIQMSRKKIEDHITGLVAVIRGYEGLVDRHGKQSAAECLFVITQPKG